MKPLAHRIALLCLLCLAAAEPPAASRRGEVRALWVVRSSITSEAAVGKLVADAKAAGINTLIVQVRGRGDAYYRSRLEPRAESLKNAPAGFDPLKSVLARARPAGIRVHAWLNTHLICDVNDLPSDPGHIFRSHPDWLAVPRRLAAELASLDPRDPRYRDRIVRFTRENTSELEGIFTDPANPEVQDHLAAVFLDVASNYDVDGIHFDFVRYPNGEFSYSRIALDRFRASLDDQLSREALLREDQLAKTRPLASVDLHPEAWDRFRRDQITGLVERISAAVRARKPRLLVSAAVFSNDDDAFHNRFQDWKSWLRRGLLDVVCPMAYTQDTAVWKRQISVARGAAAGYGKKVWAGIGAWRQSPDRALEKIQAGRRLGVDGFVFFSYGQMVSPSEWSPSGDYLARVGRRAFR
ncbi:MAG TPA: family 10 glycosylhydrolase [Thermoanaerobaculia bacterium]|nr:family 10 glycosylhydrolase [Thermoanaerobaculia bacterium]